MSTGEPSGRNNVLPLCLPATGAPGRASSAWAGARPIKWDQRLLPPAFLSQLFWCRPCTGLSAHTLGCKSARTSLAGLSRRHCSVRPGAPLRLCRLSASSAGAHPGLHTTACVPNLHTPRQPLGLLNACEGPLGPNSGSCKTCLEPLCQPLAPSKGPLLGPSLLGESGERGDLLFTATR